ncbi:hypothetical protein GLOIN_2v1780990 [Rhizophagus clarus]|uniref:CTLH domain-containing protein n=1 Tax=Rhizophagus clarus TaxID=94130 RepID=A0A8H3M0P1_9GLOM|nr:hypothetical protein GLOIN_2v1780990 [Rhizophagus clarus]
MFIEAHWKVLKLIVHQKRKFEQITIGREKSDWKSAFKSQWKLLAKWQLKSTSIAQTSYKINFLKNNNGNECEECEELYNRLITTTENILQILKEQKAVENLKWGKSVEKNFHSIIKM